MTPGIASRGQFVALTQENFARRNWRIYRVHDSWMAVPQRGDKDASDGVEIALPVDVPKKQSLGAIEDHRVLQEIRSGLKIDEGALEQVFLSQ